MDYAGARREVQELSDRYGMAVRPDARIESIGVAQQQRVEILKALYRKARVLILDEPTAVLTPQETEELFGVIRTLREQGTSIIFITHKLGEVLEIADRITVLRRGEAVATVPAEGATQQGLAELMVGRSVLLRVEKKPAAPQRAGARGARPARARQPRAGGRQGRVVRRPRGRDRGHRRRGRKRPVRAGGGDRRAGQADGRRDPGERHGHRRQGRPGEPGGRHRTHPRGSPAARPGARLHTGREPGPARLPQPPGLGVRGAATAPHRVPRARAAGGVRRPRRRAATPRPARSPAATSRRWWRPARCRATRRF